MATPLVDQFHYIYHLIICEQKFSQSLIFFYLNIDEHVICY